MQKKEIRIKLSSYDFALLDQWVNKIVEISLAANAKIKGPIPLPTKKELFTFQRSPHVNKPSMEQFERRTHRRLVVISDFTPEVIMSIKKLELPVSLLANFQIK